MSVVWEKGVHAGIITPNKFVAVTSTNAAKIFNLYPKKGRIAVGSDGDIVVWNPNAKRTISVETQHQTCDFNIFEGTVCHGGPEIVIVKGRVCAENGNVDAVKGFGSYLNCNTHAPFVYDAMAGNTSGEISDNYGRHNEQLDAEIPYIEPLALYLAKLKPKK